MTTNRKLIALDLDGTTLNAASQLSQPTIQTLQQLSASGQVVAIITGRSFFGAQAIYDQLQLNTPMINFNGALGHLPHQKWEPEYQFAVNKAIALKLTRLQHQLGIRQIIAEGKQTVLSTGATADAQAFFPETLTADPITPENLKWNPNSIVLIVDHSQRQLIIDWLTAQYGQLIDIGVWGGPHDILELTSKGIHKAKGLAYLAKYYQIGQSDVIAFGDEHNDREMLEYAGLGVAMQNATPAIKAVANDITRFNNDQDGVARYLQHYFVTNSNVLEA